MIGYQTGVYGWVLIQILAQIYLFSYSTAHIGTVVKKLAHFSKNFISAEITGRLWWEKKSQILQDEGLQGPNFLHLGIFRQKCTQNGWLEHKDFMKAPIFSEIWISLGVWNDHVKKNPQKLFTSMPQTRKYFQKFNILPQILIFRAWGGHGETSVNFFSTNFVT